jgi:hypothetical protein
MKRIRFLIWLSLAAAMSVLVLGFARGGYWALSSLPIALALIWLLGVRYERRWLIGLVLLAYAFAAMAVSLLGLSPVWLIAGVTSLLVAWDLQIFNWRIKPAAQVNDEERFVQRHLQRLAALCTLGLLLSLAALLLRLRLGFGLIVLLGGLAVLGLRQGLYLAQRVV